VGYGVRSFVLVVGCKFTWEGRHGGGGGAVEAPSRVHVDTLPFSGLNIGLRWASAKNEAQDARNKFRGQGTNGAVFA
jgi:hypothetical protein